MESMITEQVESTLQEMTVCLEEGRLRELVNRLDDDEAAACLPALDLCWLRAELARRGRGPLSDLLLAAHAHLEARTDRARGLVEAATRALEELGCKELSSALGEAAAALPQGEPAALTVHERATALLVQAAEARRGRDFARAADLSREAAGLGERSDRGPELALVAALDAWASGDPGALEALRRIRDDEAASGGLRRQARETLNVIEAEPGRGVEWLWAGDLAPLPWPEEPPATASHLRAALEAAGQAVLRCCVEEASVARHLGTEGVALVLEEEQSTRSAFLLVKGLERTARLILVEEPGQPGALLRPFPEQVRRSALFGQGALVACGVGAAGIAAREALGHQGILDDARFALVDRAHFDPQDPDVPHAHVARLARQAVAACPEIPAGHCREGEALLGLLVQGHLEEERHLMERWVAHARERFPEAEWPHQIYAQALEHWGHFSEALIAWCDATNIDPEDWRNLMGQARAVRSEGGFGSARRSLRRALTARPTEGRAWVWLAEEALAEGRLPEADVAISLGAALLPEDPQVLTLKGAVAEAHGEAGEATRLFARAVELDAEGVEHGQHIRLWRHLLWSGQWEALEEHAQGMVTLFGSSGGAWSVYLDTQLSRADLGRALDASQQALGRVGAQRALLHSMVEVLLHLVPPRDLGGVWEAFEDRLAGQPHPLSWMASQLVLGGQAAGLSFLEALGARHPEEVNTAYALARVKMRMGDLQGARPVLERVVRLAEDFPWPRYLLGMATLEGEPEKALEVLSPAAQAAPVLFWDAMAEALGRLGRPADVEELRVSLMGVSHAVLEHVGFLRDCGLAPTALRLLALALGGAEKSGASRGVLHLEMGRCLAQLGRWDEALGQLTEAEALGPDPVSGTLFLRVAAEVGSPALILEGAPALLGHCRKDSRRFTDPWVVEGVQAAAAQALGDEGLRERFLERAGRHVQGLRHWARAQQALKAPTLASDLEHLSEVAPGSADLIQHFEV